MNALQGVLTKINSLGGLAHLSLKLCPPCEPLEVDTLLLLEENTKHLQVGQTFNIVFKETAIILASSIPSNIQFSTKNIFTSTIVDMQKDDLFCRVIMDYHGLSICALIFLQRAEELQLHSGMSIFWLLNDNEIMLKSTNNSK